MDSPVGRGTDSSQQARLIPREHRAIDPRIEYKISKVGTFPIDRRSSHKRRAGEQTCMETEASISERGAAAMAGSGASPQPVARATCGPCGGAGGCRGDLELLATNSHCGRNELPS